jgi:hypothetical protein
MMLELVLAQMASGSTGPGTVVAMGSFLLTFLGFGRYMTYHLKCKKINKNVFFA